MCPVLEFKKEKKNKQQPLNLKIGLNQVMFLVGKAKLAAKLGVAQWPNKPFSTVTPKIVVRLTEEKRSAVVPRKIPVPASSAFLEF